MFNLKTILLAVGVFILLSPILFVAAKFAQTSVFFTVPVSLSFTVTLPGGTSTTSNTTSDLAYLSTPATSDIWFNSSSQTAQHIQPCVAGGSSCQTGAAVPIFSYDNTGNVNMSIWMKFNSSLESGVAVCMNSTRSGTGNMAVDHAGVANCYDLNNSQWVEVVSNLTSSGVNITNATLYANFTSKAVGTTIRRLDHNTTQTTGSG